jgi:hypothetical protein
MNISSYSSSVAAYKNTPEVRSSSPDQKAAPKRELEKRNDGDQDDAAILKAAIATENSKAASSLIGQNLNELA